MSEIIVKSKNINNINIKKSQIYIPKIQRNIQTSIETKETLNEEKSSESNSNNQMGQPPVVINNNINRNKQNTSLIKSILNNNIYYHNNRINDIYNKRNDISDSRVYEMKRSNSKQNLNKPLFSRSHINYGFEKKKINYINGENNINTNVIINSHEISNELQTNNYQNVLPYQMPYDGAINQNIYGDYYANQIDINNINYNQYKINNRINCRKKSRGRSFNCRCNCRGCGDICCLVFCEGICSGCAKALCFIF